VSILEGAPNFRDLGGLPAAEGARLRSGLVFRSEAFGQLTDDDLGRLRGLGIRLVCDLRSMLERQRMPGRWPEKGDAEVLHLEITADAKAGDRSFMHILAEDFSARGARDGILATYRAMPFRFRQRLATLFDRLSRPANLAAVIHCSAGKDRTGFATAMLLHALGTPLEAIREDYLRTMQLRDPRRSAVMLAPMIAQAVGRTPTDEILAPLLCVETAYLDAAFNAIAEAFGSLDAYLQEVGGLDPAKRAQLRELLLT
jgi:protein-tyrosine phosphatase